MANILVVLKSSTCKYLASCFLRVKSLLQVLDKNLLGVERPST